MSLITIQNFHSLTEAYLVRSKLENEGIVCYLADEHMVGLKLNQLAYKGGMKLKINSADLKAATELLRLMGYTVPGHLVRTCPSCGETNITTIQSKTRGIRSLALAFRSFFVSLNPFSKPKIYCCNNCDARF